MNNIPIHKFKDFEGMRKAGKLTAKILDELNDIIQPGISTDKINNFCHDMILDNGATPAPLGYRGFPKSICTSVNHIVCHGIPSENKILQSGDIINIDVTVILNGWHGDSSRMFVVGRINKKAENLIKITYECLLKGIEVAIPGNHFGDIGYQIQKYAESKKYSVVRDFCGHGIGKIFHTPPSVLHFGKPNEGDEIKPGMFFTIEPMINIGKKEVKILNDGWTAVTRDKSLSAQFEHTIGITEKGNEIFTLSQNNSYFPLNIL
ncbi:MAG: Methionine aminopeptidase [Alphaproteobacteria bacterium MarineAlpha5_Bin9]|nr:MAG: Methionine aminopeptidase [Alphaproteobacteria bacterium MarineAlpha5_Bin9]|tara:strand:- start:21261 stop:22049 length:789 start_codon:yes stop_codon:yes gene_type:complete